MEKPSLIRVTVDLPKDMRRSMRIACACHGMTMRELVTQAIREKLEKLKGK